MQYQLIRSARRKSVAIQVREQRVVVRAPFFVCEKAIESLVAKKRHGNQR